MLEINRAKERNTKASGNGSSVRSLNQERENGLQKLYQEFIFYKPSSAITQASQVVLWESTAEHVSQGRCLMNQHCFMLLSFVHRATCQWQWHNSVLILKDIRFYRTTESLGLEFFFNLFQFQVFLVFPPFLFRNVFSAKTVVANQHAKYCQESIFTVCLMLLLTVF